MRLDNLCYWDTKVTLDIVNSWKFSGWRKECMFTSDIFSCWSSISIGTYCVSCLSKYSSSFLRQKAALQCCNTTKLKNPLMSWQVLIQQSLTWAPWIFYSLGKAVGNVEYAEELPPEWYHDNNPSAFIAILLLLPSCTRRRRFMAFSFYGEDKAVCLQVI